MTMPLKSAPKSSRILGQVSSNVQCNLTKLEPWSIVEPSL